MQFVAREQLPAEQTAEDTQAQGVRLADACRRRQPETHLSEHHAAYDRQYQQRDHPQHIVGRSRADRLVDEAAAEPHHQQAEHHMPDACHDAYRHVPADASQVTPKPNQVIH